MSNNFYVKDFIAEGKTDTWAIENCIKEAQHHNGAKTIIFDSKDYYIDRAIVVPNDTEVIIDGCSIKQNREVFDNVFRGANLILSEDDPYGAPLDVKPQKNIKIIGKNGAKIIGTSKPRVGYHPMFEEEQLMVGDFWGWRTHMFSFSLGENIEIGGLTLLQTMCWAISFDCCHDLYIHDLEIHSNVKNGDGVDFRSGCYNCRVENISGYTSDDTVACTALASGGRSGYPAGKYLYPSEPYNCLGREFNRDIHDVIIKNITTGGLHHGVICLAALSNQVYNIKIDTIKESKQGSRTAIVSIYTGYGDGYNSGDIHDIEVSNVTSETAKYAVEVNAEVKDVIIDNIVQNNPDGELTFGI